MLEAYCGVLHATLDGGQNSAWGATFRMGSGQDLNPITPKELVTIPGGAQPYDAIMAVFDMGTVEPGNYTLEMTVEGNDRQTRATRRAEFTMQ